MTGTSSAHTATITLPRSVIFALADDLGNDAVFEQHSIDLQESGPDLFRLIVYFEIAPPRDLRTRLSKLSRLAGAAKGARFAFRRLPPTDWVAKSLEGLKPVRAGRYLVHGRHDRSQRRANDIAIEIEAGQAFGTGHHGTTAGCLLALDKILKSRRPGNAVDIGTGSGVLAIALAKTARIPVLATDIDPVATDVARSNMGLNGVKSLVSTHTATGTHHRQFQSHGPFDLIVANILARPLTGLAYPITRIAAPGATLVLSGLLPDQRRRLVATYRNVGFILVRSLVLDGWLTIIMQAGHRHRLMR